MMTSIISYLTFDGNCREAMTFYKECLGGELQFQTLGNAPLGDKMPAAIKEHILLATLSNNELVIMATDMTGDPGRIKGNAISLMLNFTAEKEIETCYRKLSAGGIADQPLENTFWGDLFGGLTDKFGNQWLLNYSRKP